MYQCSQLQIVLSCVCLFGIYGFSPGHVGHFWYILHINTDSICMFHSINSLNIPKTHFMVFSNKHKQAHNINIEINHEKVIECKNTTFLGIWIDANLTWKPHIHNVCSKLTKCMEILSKAKHVLPRSAIVCLYYTPAYPYLMYCNEV